ncbi:GntR family transcriptional regulator [Novosphingobium nitrogenifigens]|nr:FCD domain-containing protein [Novosphingobium nitrogenifigens]
MTVTSPSSPPPAPRLPAPRPEASGTPKSLIVGTYERLRADIIAGRYAPGSRLRVEHLKTDYDVGAGTLREALGLLVSDALVLNRDQRGFWVADMSLDDFRDITETRVLLETSALRQSIAARDDDWEGDLSSAFHRLSRAEERLDNSQPATVLVNDWEECNRRFHHVLLARCPSHWTLHFLSILYRQAERYRRVALMHRPIGRDVHAEHRAVFEAAIAGKADEAADVTATHIRTTYAALVAYAKEHRITQLVPDSA